MCDCQKCQSGEPRFRFHRELIEQWDARGFSSTMDEIDDEVKKEFKLHGESVQFHELLDESEHIRSSWVTFAKRRYTTIN